MSDSANPIFDPTNVPESNDVFALGRFSALRLLIASRARFIDGSMSRQGYLEAVNQESLAGEGNESLFLLSSCVSLSSLLLDRCAKFSNIPETDDFLREALNCLLKLSTIDKHSTYNNGLFNLMTIVRLRVTDNSGKLLATDFSGVAHALTSRLPAVDAAMNMSQLTLFAMHYSAAKTSKSFSEVFDNVATNLDAYRGEY